MRTRILIGTVVGTVVAFLYGFTTWAALGLWDGKIQSVPAGSTLAESFAAQVVADGAYSFPPHDKARYEELAASGRPEDAAAAKAMRTAFEAAHEHGPVGMVIIRKQGMPVMSAGTFACSIGFDLLCAGFMAFFIAATACPSWAGRWMYGVMIAAFAAMVANASDVSWFHFPVNYVMYDIADIFLKWTTVSAAVALVVSPATSCPFHKAAPAAA